MAYATTDEGVRLHFDGTGSGVPIVFVLEFAGDSRSCKPQLHQFGRTYR